ncbi:MAG: hypothetical protein HY399_04285 [Elusimicrobia bacterium]|nr:hypothetical protein [Elusimicrobiota bacterium]
MDQFKIAQLTKELVVAELRNSKDACLIGAEILKKTLLVALKETTSLQPGIGKVVSDACQGAMVGLLVSEQNLTKGAILLLQKVGEVASELNLDPTEMMMMALRGIADIQRFVEPQQVDDIRDEITRNFLGAGEAFTTILSQSHKTNVPQ